MTLGVTNGEQDCRFFRKQRNFRHPLLEKSEISGQINLALLEKVT